MYEDLPNTIKQDFINNLRLRREAFLNLNALKKELDEFREKLDFLTKKGE
jgi:hypothetical protein